MNSEEAFKDDTVVNKEDSILLVEDEIALRDILKIILEEDGFIIRTASDGEEAVEVFRKHKDEIGVVLSDLGLPKLGGWEAFLKMKEINPKVQGILASGFFNPNVREEIIKSGVNYFVEKPYDPPALMELLRTLLKK